MTSRAEPGAGDGLVRALAALDAGERRAGDGLPRPRQPLDPRDEVEVDAADDGDARRSGASARRSSTVEPSRVSRRSNRPAQSDEASGGASSRAASERPCERADEHGQLEIGRRDAVRAGVHAGARQHRPPLDELPRAGPRVPGATLGLLGLELEQVAAERRLEPGERRLDPVGGMAERRLAAAGGRGPRLARGPSARAAGRTRAPPPRSARSCPISRRAVSSLAGVARPGRRRQDAH